MCSTFWDFCKNNNLTLTDILRFATFATTAYAQLINSRQPQMTPADVIMLMLNMSLMRFFLFFYSHFYYILQFHLLGPGS